MAEINLLPVEEKEAEGFLRLQKRLTIASVIFLTAAAVFTLATLIFFTSLASERSKLNDRVEAASAKIDSEKGTEELLVVVKKKAAVAEKILGGRTVYNNIFNELSELVPQFVYFSDIKFTGQKMSMSGRAKTSADIAKFISQLVSQKGLEMFGNVNIDSLNSDDKGSYAFVVTMDIVGKIQGQVTK